MQRKKCPELRGATKRVQFYEAMRKVYGLVGYDPDLWMDEEVAMFRVHLGPAYWDADLRWCRHWALSVRKHPPKKRSAA